jgi:hypothetical protein
MSPHTVNNFVSDLVDMAKAVEELPRVRLELERANDLLKDRQSYIDAISEDLTQFRSYAASLEQKVRDAEVAKDQAETMFLEADERTSRAMDFIKTSFGSAGALIQALEPVKAMPVEQGESASPLAPIPNPSQYFSGGPSDHGESHSGESVGVGQAPNSSPAQGQSEPNPAPSAADALGAKPYAQRYEGLRWSEANPKSDHFIGFSEWLEGGGTEASWSE